MVSLRSLLVALFCSAGFAAAKYSGVSARGQRRWPHRSQRPPPKLALPDAPVPTPWPGRRVCHAFYNLGDPCPGANWPQGRQPQDARRRTRRPGRRH